MPAYIPAPYISIQNIIFELPDGRRLFDDLSCTFDNRQTAIVGPNGIGKSVLAKIIAGKVLPSSGSVQARGSVGFVPQFWPGSDNDSLAKVLGIDQALAAMAAIEKGDTDQHCFDVAEPWWDWRTRFELLNAELYLPEFGELSRPIGSYSGGEQLRWLWAAALLNNPDIVVMDEPSNHLDRQGREFFNKWLQQCEPLVIVVSHDREILSTVNHIVELSNQTCFQHSGNFDVYQYNRQQRLKKQQKNVAIARQKVSVEKHHAQVALEKQQQRVAGGRAKAVKKSLSAVEIGAARNQASASQHRAGRMHSERLGIVQNKLKELRDGLEWQEPIAFKLPCLTSLSRKICTVEKLQNSFTQALHPTISFALVGAQRLHIVGRNGSGKSLLLKCMARDANPSCGRSDIHVPFALLDQHTSCLNPTESGVENFCRLCPGLSAQQYRERLAWLRLRSHKADICVGELSGGEQMKVAIAVALLGPQRTQLLLLDEPSNHLDVDSLAALEQSLAAYHGALILVSHDQLFASKLQLTHQLNLETAEFTSL